LIIYIIGWVTWVPIKLFITFGCLAVATIAANLINLGTDPQKPLPPTRSKRFYTGNAIVGRILCLGHGLIVIQKNKHLRDKKANLLCGNHCSYLDAIVMSTIGGGSAVAN